MYKILFTHSYFLRFDAKQWTTGQPYPPLGTLYAAAVMREKGYEVNFKDTMFATGPEEIMDDMRKHRPDFFVIYDDGFNYLTKMCLTNMREAAFQMIQIAKEFGCKVIVSSSDSTDHFEKYLSKGADFILIGEAELTLQELVEAVNNGVEDFSSVEGLAYFSQQELVRTPRRKVIRELDKLPFPAWDLLDISPYKSTWLKHVGFFSMNMGTTRGCPFKCNWCAKPIYGNRYNSRTPQNVLDELKLMKEKFAFDHIWFCDDIFGLKPGWVKEFADLVNKENFKFRFKIQVRADLVLQEDYVMDLAKAGCETAWMGAESGSQKILDAMDKGTTVEQIYEATRLLKKHGIKPCFFIQFGYPGEKNEDILKTMQMINQLLPFEIGISVSYPLPGTVFYERVKADLKEKANWTDSDELILMFRNTYPPAFYKQLHRYVHKNYRLHLAIDNIKGILRHPLGTNLRKLKRAASLAYYFPATVLAKQKLDSLQTSPG